MSLSIQNGLLAARGGRQPTRSSSFFGSIASLAGDLLKKGAVFIGSTIKGAINQSGAPPGGAPFPGTPGIVQQVPGGSGGRTRFPVLPQIVVPTPGPRGAIERFLPGGGTGLQVATNGAGAPKGFHLNKSSYFLKDGTFIEKGSVWVKNRRRNPLNPRALRHAIGRIDAGKVWQAKFAEISTGKFTAAGNRKDCPS